MNYILVGCPWIVDRAHEDEKNDMRFVMSLIRTDYVPEWRISAHAQSVLAAGQKHHNSSPLASACNMVTNKDLKR